MRRFGAAAARSWGILAASASLGILVATTLHTHLRTSTNSARLAAFDSVLDELLLQYPVPVNVSPDGKLILTKTRSKSGFQICVVRRADSRQVVSNFSESSQLQLTWSPDSTRIAFLSNHLGDAEFKLYLWDLSKRRVRLIEVGPVGTAALPLRWSPDCRHLMLASDGRDGRLLCVDMRTGRVDWCAEEPLQQDSEFDFSPSGAYAAYFPDRTPSCVRFRSQGRTPREMSIAISRGGEARHLAWSSRGDRLLCTVRLPGKEFFELFEADRVSGKVRSLAQPSFDVCHPRYLADERTAEFESDEGGQSRLFTVDLMTKTTTLVRTSPGIVRIVQRIAPTGRQIAYLAPIQSPPVVAELSLPSGNLRSVFPPSFQSNSAKRKIGVKVIETTCGEGVHVYVLQPKGGSVIHGAVIVVHGGVRQHSSPKWDAGLQLLVRSGFLVALVNYRGSSGYGRRYERFPGLEGQAKDVLQCGRFLLQRWRVLTDRQVLLCESSGCAIGCRAAELSVGRFLGVVLVSPASLPLRPIDDARRPAFIQVYQGLQDPIRSKFCVENNFLRFAKAFGSLPLDCATVFEAEGHNLQRTSSWAEVYARILGGA